MLTNNGALELEKHATTQLVMDTAVVEYSATNIEYLLKTIEICKEYNVEVVLIRSPVHAKYIGRTHEITFRYIQKRYLHGIEFLDYKNYGLEDRQFADLHHLNKKGALQFSLFFNEVISKRND